MLTPKDKRKWLFIGIGFAIIAIICIVVPAVVVTTNKQKASASSSSNAPAYAMAQSPYDNLTRTRNLDELKDRERIFVIGDVHGCANELATLLEDIKYNKTTDAVILAGDLTMKGYDSPGVLDLAMRENIYCVRGNHDDMVVRFKTYGISTGSIPKGNQRLPEGDVADPLKFDDEHAVLARNLTDAQYNYLAACPMAVELPFLNAYVVHGGLDPNVDDVANNDPYTVFNVRDVVNGVPTRDNDIGGHWTDWYQIITNTKNTTRKVYYGHDASRGLDLEAVTFGLDSACVYGHKLSALEIYTHALTQVNCPKYAN
ncbi:Metallo-dependent phosphatase [Hesseltinella vesiculosa]|uniref:Metallo-dependent phosphatase n=1 Tax=Hesseltinella vesiculosa TaxID=101127 RepID=A0A1X2GIX4_9FUNG|nr:Metallo-dependent phosphatase [Hesseltinella vesiculosa]